MNVANLQNLERVFDAKERKEARIAERKADRAAQQKAAKQAERVCRKQEAQTAVRLKAEQEAERRQLRRAKQDRSCAAAAGLCSNSCLQTHYLEVLFAFDAPPTNNRLCGKTGFDCMLIINWRATKLLLLRVYICSQISSTRSFESQDDAWREEHVC